MTTFQTGQTVCARNLPQHFNGCACTPATGGLTSEVDIDLSEMGSSAADLLMEQIEAMRREAYEEGQRDAYAKMGVAAPIPPIPDPWAGAGDGRPYVPAAPKPGDTVACGACLDHPGFGYSVGDGLASGTCYACNGTGTQIVPGDDAVGCVYCSATGKSHKSVPDETKGGGWQRTIEVDCPVCRGTAQMAPTPSGQDEVFVPGYGTFGLSGTRSDGTEAHPGTPYAMRLEANRPLTDAETQRAAQLLGYNYRAAIAGEPLGDPQRDSDRSFVVSADSTKSSRDDLGIGFEEFEDNLDAMLHEGSPVRKTDRSGPGTKNTRLVDGLGDPDLKFRVYYDDTYPGL